MTLAMLDELDITDQLKPKITWVRERPRYKTAGQRRGRDCFGSIYLREMDNPGLDIVGALSPGFPRRSTSPVSSHQCQGPQSRQAAPGLSGVARGGGDFIRKEAVTTIILFWDPGRWLPCGHLQEGSDNRTLEKGEAFASYLRARLFWFNRVND